MAGNSNNPPHLLERDSVGGEDVVGCHLVDDLPVLSSAAVLHGDGLDEAVVLVHGEDVEGRVAPHVLVDDERASLLEGARVRVRVEGLLVDLEEETFFYFVIFLSAFLSFLRFNTILLDVFEFLPHICPSL